MKHDPGYASGQAAAPLCEMEIGQRAVICSLQASDSIRRRLIDLGFIEGTTVQCVLKGPWGASAAFLVRDTVIALRRADAAQIRVCFISQ